MTHTQADEDNFRKDFVFTFAGGLLHWHKHQTAPSARSILASRQPYIIGAAIFRIWIVANNSHEVAIEHSRSGVVDDPE